MAQTRYALLPAVDADAMPRLARVEQCTPAGEDRVALQAGVEAPLMENREGVSRIALFYRTFLGPAQIFFWTSGRAGVQSNAGNKRHRPLEAFDLTRQRD